MNIGNLIFRNTQIQQLIPNAIIDIKIAIVMRR